MAFLQSHILFALVSALLGGFLLASLLWLCGLIAYRAIQQEPDDSKALKTSMIAIRSEAHKALGILNRFSQKTVKSLAVAACYLLVWGFRLSWWIKRVMRFAVFVVFVVAGFFSLIEILLKLGIYLSGIQTVNFIPVSPSHLKIVTDVLDSWKFLVPSFLVEVAVVYHHILEHRRIKAEPALIAMLGVLLEPLNDLNRLLAASSNAAEIADAKNDFWRNFSYAFAKHLAQRGIDDVDVSIMALDPAHEDNAVDNSKRLLRVVFESSIPQRYNKKFTLHYGKGAAGKAAEAQSVIYVPATPFLHGIQDSATERKVLRNVYVQSENPFKSMLCAPISDSASNTVGVINFFQRPLERILAG